MAQAPPLTLIFLGKTSASILPWQDLGIYQEDRRGADFAWHTSRRLRFWTVAHTVAETRNSSMVLMGDQLYDPTAGTYAPRIRGNRKVSTILELGLGGNQS